MTSDLALEWATVWRGKSIFQVGVLRFEVVPHKEIRLVLLWCLQLLLLFFLLQASNCRLKCGFLQNRCVTALLGIAAVVFERYLLFFLTLLTDSDIDWEECYFPCSSSSSGIYIHTYV